MSLYYTQLLIPSAHAYLPQREQLARFADKLLETGAFGELQRLGLANHDAPSRIRRGFNPATGGTIEVASPTRTRLQAPAELVTAAQGLRNFDFELGGSGPGRKPLLPAVGGLEEGKWSEWRDPYDLTVSCCFRSQVVSTSDLHEESPGNREAVPFGEACHPREKTGLYSNPYTLEVIEVAGTGCASFWIEINLGKWLFPRIEGNNLALVDSEYLDAAEAIFGIRFLQGCRWG